MQFGYVALFAAALPMASLMALANNLIELRTDAWKMLTQHRRPVAQASDEVGSLRGSEPRRGPGLITPVGPKVPGNSQGVPRNNRDFPYKNFT